MKQKKAVEALVGTGGNVTRAMLAAGYSENTANTPQKLTESKGFEEICKDAGLTDELLTKALADDIAAKSKRRVQELSLAADILGRKKNRMKVTGKDGGPLELIATEKAIREILEKK